MKGEFFNLMERLDLNDEGGEEPEEALGATVGAEEALDALVKKPSMHRDRSASIGSNKSDSDAAVLHDKEEMESGDVSWDAYKYFIKSIGTTQLSSTTGINSS